MNKYFKVSLTLATIASGAALLIGLMNLATVGAIKANKADKIKNGISKLYPDVANYQTHDFLFADEEGFNENYNAAVYPHIKTCYVVEGASKNGYVYSTTGKNGYGQVDLLLSINNGEIGKIFVVTNTESYGPTLEENYIDLYNYGLLEHGLEDVQCGATYGAKTVKEQCDDALAHWSANFGREAE